MLMRLYVIRSRTATNLAFPRETLTYNTQVKNKRKKILMVVIIYVNDKILQIRSNSFAPLTNNDLSLIMFAHLLYTYIFDVGNVHVRL